MNGRFAIREWPTLLPDGFWRRVPAPVAAVFGLIGISVYFFVLVQPAARANEQAVLRVAEIPLLAEQAAAAARRHDETVEAAAAAQAAGVAGINKLRDDAPLSTVYRELARIARECGLAVVSMDVNAAWEKPDDAAAFSRARAGWKLAGGYHDYLAFRRSLANYRRVLHIDRERLSGGGKRLDIALKFSVHRMGEVH